jgi:hypothetical protein
MVSRHFGVIRWEKMDGPLAGWLTSIFEVRIDKGAADGASKWVSVQGWKGSSNIDEEQELTGATLISVTNLESKMFQSYTTQAYSFPPVLLLRVPSWFSSTKPSLTGTKIYGKI